MATQIEILDKLVEIFDATGSFSQVYARRPMDPQGMTPILAIYVIEARPKRRSGSHRDKFYTYALDVMLLRTDTDAEEEDLCALHEVVIDTVDAHLGWAGWDHHYFDDCPSWFETIEGNPYRGQIHPLVVKVTGG